MLRFGVPRCPPLQVDAIQLTARVSLSEDELCLSRVIVSRYSAYTYHLLYEYVESIMWPWQMTSLAGVTCLAKLAICSGKWWTEKASLQDHQYLVEYTLNTD